MASVADVQTMSPALKPRHSRQLRTCTQGQSNSGLAFGDSADQSTGVISTNRRPQPTFCLRQRSNNSMNASLEIQLTSQSNHSIPAPDDLYSEDPELTCDLKGDPEIAEVEHNGFLQMCICDSMYLELLTSSSSAILCSLLISPQFTLA